MSADIDSYRGEAFTLSGRVTRGKAIVTAAVLAGAAAIPVDSTGGYPGAGSLDLDGTIVAYTGVTATSFTGCTGTPAINAGVVVPVAVDLRTASALVFTARRSRGGAAVVSKTLGGGVTVPVAAPGHAYSIAIAAGDTNAFTRVEQLLYELRLTESNGDVTVVAEGIWRVGLGAS